MKDIKVKDILKICNAKLICGSEEVICENFSKDTRTINKNDVYVGIKGENFDGNLLYETAFEMGAEVCILENINENAIKSEYKNKTIIKVENTIKALQQIATYKRSLYDIPVIAVTGSVGKTSTKDILAEVVSQEYKVLKTEGNYNNHIGVPLTILGLKDHTALVVEMGMSDLGEISVLTKIAKPTVAVITNVGTAHIGKLGSRQNILKAKMEILEGLEKQGTLVINNDNDLLNEWNNTNKAYKVCTFGIENESNIMAKNVILSEYSSNFDAVIDKKDLLKVEVPVGGKHFIYNALCAIAVGKILNIDINKILKGIKEFKLTKSRMEIIKNSNNITIINDCYNANYDSMKAGIETLAKINGKRKVAVLGDMLELGEYSEDLHRKVGLEIIKNKIDLLITVGINAKYINDEVAKNQSAETYHFNNNEDALSKLNKILRPDDVILIKASNGMHFNEIVKKII